MNPFTPFRAVARLILGAILLCLSLAHAVEINYQAGSNSAGSWPESPAADILPIPTPGSDVNTLQAVNALYRGTWDQAMALAATAISQRTHQIAVLGTFTVAAVMLGDQVAVDKALPQLIAAENPPYFAAIAQAVQALQAGDAGAAEAQLQGVLALAPKDSLALYFRGELEHLRGDSQTALATFREVLEVAPEFAPALAAVSRLLPEELGKQSIALMERAAAIHPSNVAYRRRLAGLYAAAGRGEEANRLYAELLKDVPGVKERYLSTAWQLQRNGSPEAALEHIGKALGYWGPTPLGSLVAAMASIDLGREAEARVHLKDYEASAANKAQAYLASGLCLLALGDAPAARTRFGETLKRQPGNGQALLNRAVAEQMAGDTIAARKTLQQARQVGEHAAATAFVDANLALAAGDAASYQSRMLETGSLLPGFANIAAPALAGGTRADPRAAVHGNVMLVMFLNQWFAQAVSQADLAMAARPGDAVAGYFRAIAFERMGRLGEAATALEALVADQPRFAGAQIALGRVAAQTKDAATALRAFRAASEVEPGSVPALLGMAAALFVLEEKEQVTQVLARAESSASTGQELFQVALAYRKSGNQSKSKSLAERALATQDQGKWRQEVASMLAVSPE